MVIFQNLSTRGELRVAHVTFALWDDTLLVPLCHLDLGLCVARYYDCSYRLSSDEKNEDVILS